MKSKTPPDGLCLYHAILGALQPAAHTSVPRAQLGFARNPRQQRAESDAARQLELMAFGENKHDPAVDLQDLALVGERLQLAIRCTVADEVAKHFADAGEHMLQDAVHGIDRYPPDVHVYYSWHTNPDSGIKYSRYECLLQCKREQHRRCSWRDIIITYQSAFLCTCFRYD